jgi:hypothetical protein
MKRPEDIRVAPTEWVKILQVAYPFLHDKAGDLVIFGSQALSVYMKSPLRSKDLDMLSAQVGPHQMDQLATKLSNLENVDFRSSSVQSRLFGSTKMTTYAIELRIKERPFFVEVFDRILDGQAPSILQPYVEHVKRWELDVWVPDREATVALRMAFRQPEGISRFNATRLNAFIDENRRSIRFKRVSSILHKWNIEAWVEKNLIDLYRRNRLRIIGDGAIIPGIEKKLG